MALAFKQSKLNFLHLNSVNLRTVFAQGMAMFFIQDLAAPAVAIHAAVAESAANAFAGPFTNPAYPKSIRAVSQNGYGGGIVTITGTDQFGRAQTESITPAAGGGTVEGVKIWRTVTAAAKTSIVADTHTVTLQTGVKIGLPVPLLGDWGMELVAGVAELATWDSTYHAFTPTTPPDGAVDFTILVPVDWAAYAKMVVGEAANI